MPHTSATRPAILAWATIVALLWLTMMERAVHALFVVSLAALGVSPTLLAIPLLFSGFLYPIGLWKLWPHTERFLTTTTIVALASMLLMIVVPSAWAVIAAAIAVLALTVLLVDVIAKLGLAMLLPSVLAVLLAITLRTLNHTAPLGLTSRGSVLLLVVVVCAAVLRRYASSPDRPAPTSLAGTAAVIAFLLVQYQLLGSPSALSTLHAPPTDFGWWYFAILVSCQIGLLAGLHASARLGANTINVGFVAAAHLAGIALLITGIGYIAAPVWLIIAQATGVFLLSAALSRDGRTVGSAGARAGALQVVWWLLVVLHAFATKWPFLPSALRPVLEGKATIYLLLSFAILPLALLFDRERRRA